MTYIGKTGETYNVENIPLAKGGEGAVYRINGKPNLALKLFAPEKRTETRHRKLLVMIATPLSQNAMNQVTWPVDVVYENGNFVGYVMPLLKRVEDLNVMYSDKYVCTLSEKITIAKNLCAAINAVHLAGQVCGDLNPENIGVDPNTAIITLVDTDSYHITESDGRRTYRCEVGLPQYLAKEIQDKLHNNKGYDLRTVPLPTFSKETDLFALAVHIFALLMNGAHPFASATDESLSKSQPSIVNPQPVDNIRNCYFPYYEKRTGFTTPKYAPDFSILPKNIQDLFVRAFVKGGTNPKLRPDTEEWYSALEDYEKHIKICVKDHKHEYYNKLNKCPWCEIENRLNSFMNEQVTLKQTPLKGSTSINQSSLTNTSSTTKSTNNTTSTTKYSAIKRDSWPMWLLFIITGAGSGPLLSYLLVIPYIMPLIYEHVDFVIPEAALYIGMLIIGIVCGAVISHFTQDNYQTAEKGGPWLLISLLVPIATLIATVLLALLIALVVGVIYVLLVIVILVIGGAIAAACCGG